MVFCCRLFLHIFIVAALGVVVCWSVCLLVYLFLFENILEVELAGGIPSFVEVYIPDL